MKNFLSGDWVQGIGGSWSLVTDGWGKFCTISFGEERMAGSSTDFSVVDLFPFDNWCSSSRGEGDTRYFDHGQWLSILFKRESVFFECCLCQDSTCLWATEFSGAARVPDCLKIMNPLIQVWWSLCLRLPVLYDHINLNLYHSLKNKTHMLA